MYIVKKSGVFMGLGKSNDIIITNTVNLDLNSELMDELRKEKEKVSQLEKELEFYKAELNQAKKEIIRLNRIIND